MQLAGEASQRDQVALVPLDVQLVEGGLLNFGELFGLRVPVVRVERHAFRQLATHAEGVERFGAKVELVALH